MGILQRLRLQLKLELKLRTAESIAVTPVKSATSGVRWIAIAVERSVCFGFELKFELKFESELKCRFD